MLADNLQSARNAVGLTQRQASQILGVHVTTIANWEAGRSTPSSALLPMIAATYRITIPSLFMAQAS